MSASLPDPLLSQAAAAMGRRGARLKWSRMNKEARREERLRAWKTRRRKSKRRK